jgi:glycosyltransferase 2 family protein
VWDPDPSSPVVSPQMRTSVRNVLIALLALGLLTWFLRNARLGDVWREIEGADVGLLVIALGSIALNFGLRSARWQYLLAPVGHVGFRSALWATVIGFAANTLLPARAGEFVRPYLLARREGLSATAAFATIIVERLLDTLTVVLLLSSFVLLFDPGVAARNSAVFEAVRIGAAVVGATAVGGLLVMFVAAGRPGALASGALRLEGILPGTLAHKLAKAVTMFAAGLAVVRAPRRLLAAVLLSFPLWLSIAAGIWTVASAFHIAVPFTGSFLVMALLVLGVAVPTPGAVGGFHEAFRLGVTAFYAAPNDRAVGAAIVLHALSFLPVTALGLLFVVRDGLSFSGMRKLASEAAAEGGSDEVPVLRSSGR